MAPVNRPAWVWIAHMPCQRGSASADARMRSAVCDASRDGGRSQCRMASASPYASCRPSASFSAMDRRVRRGVSNAGSVMTGLGPRLRKAGVAVRIELRDVDVPVRQRLEPYRAEEGLLRLGQYDGLRKAGIVEAATEVHTRLDCKCLELTDRESRPREIKRVHDLSQILADQHDVASPEGHAHPARAGDLRHTHDRAFDPHRLAGGLVG